MTDADKEMSKRIMEKVHNDSWSKFRNIMQIKEYEKQIEEYEKRLAKFYMNLRECFEYWWNINKS